MTNKPEEITFLLGNPPVEGSFWRHHNGNLYSVIGLSNVETTNQEKYPTSVWYANIANGKRYNRPLVEWHKSMTEEILEDPSPEGRRDRLERHLQEIVDATLKGPLQFPKQQFWKSVEDEVVEFIRIANTDTNSQILQPTSVWYKNVRTNEHCNIEVHAWTDNFTKLGA